MSVTRSWFAPRHVLFALGLVGVSSVGALVPSASAAPALSSDMMPLRSVRPGMKGYGLTTYHGTTISRFHIEVVGILKKVNSGRDLILIRILDGPMVARQATLIQGMSGSPIYLNGKLVGAVSQGEGFQKEPLNMVTPIEDMLDAWDPRIPQKPSYFQPATTQAAGERPEAGGKKPVKAEGQRPEGKGSRSTSGSSGSSGGTGSRTGHGREVSAQSVTLPEPITVHGRRISRLVLNARADDPRRSHGETAVFYRATTLLSVTGIREPQRLWLQKELDQRGYAITVVQGPMVGKAKPDFAPPALKPGSAFGAFLATGDLQIGATGTITYRKGNRVLGFGHPLFSLGALEAAITTASIVDIMPGYQVSHHIATAGQTIGTLEQDRDFSVSARLGKMPPLVPFDITVRDQTNGQAQTFRTRLLQHPDMTPLLMRLLAQQAVSQVHNVPGDVMAKVTTTLEAAEVGRISRSNVVFDDSNIAGAVTQDLTEMAGIVSGNPFYPLPVRSGRMTIDILQGHNTATVERIYLKQGRYEPGDTVEVGVSLKPYRRPLVERTISLRIPANTPTGRYQLLVRGGTPSASRIGGFLISGGNQDPQTPPASVQQMVTRFGKQPRNTDLVARLVLNTVAPAVEGEKLSELPPNLSALMRSERNSGVRLERDELRATQPTDFILNGTQQLVVTVVRKNTQEPASSGSAGGSSLPGSSGSPSPFSLGGSSSLSSSYSDDTAAPSGSSLEEMAELTPTGEKALAAIRDPETARWLAAMTDASTGEQTRKKEEPKGKAAKKPDPKKPEEKSGGEAIKAAETPAPSTEQTPAPTTPPMPLPNPADEKPVGRQMKVWRQTARADFSNGKLSGASVAATGELRLTSALRRIAATGEIYVWSLAADPQGNLYVGTGTGGKILKIDPQGKMTEYANLPVVSVQSLLFGRDGALWAGSGVKGNLYRIAPDSAPTQIATLPEKYITALAQDSKGNLFIGPSGGGTVYKLAAGETGGSPTARRLTPYLKTPSDHIMALAADAQDNLYVGTGSEGTLYKVTPDGKSAVLFDAKENAITALAVDGKGDVYAGTGPKGLLYRITADGTPTVVYERATSFFTALRTASDGTLYASTVNAIYHLTPGTNAAPVTVQPLDNAKDVDFLTLAALPDGGVAAGTGNVGEVYTSQPTPASNAPAMRVGTYESVIRDTGLQSRWGTARWNASTPEGAKIRVETRSGNVSEPDETWSAWMPVRTGSENGSEGAIVSPPARFLQYRLTLQADNGKTPPAVREVTFSYMPRNQAPRVVFQSPAGGERWAKSQTLRWNGSDPDGDTLMYEVHVSADMGATWKPLPSQASAEIKTSETKTTEGAVKPETASKEPPLPSLEEVRRQLDATTGIPQEQKDASLERYRQRLAALSGSGATFVALRETSKNWDTKSLPDGTYLFKVVASDSVSNPLEPQTSQAISEPVVIVNSAPQLRLETNKVLGSSKSVAVEGMAVQSLIAVTAVQYRVDGGDWMAAAPKDGLFDASQEGFSFVTLPLTSGKHTLEVSAFNAAGSRTTEKVEVTVP